jgi:uncharacterized MFS-type transporter YbfB
VALATAPMLPTSRRRWFLLTLRAFTLACAVEALGVAASVLWLRPAGVLLAATLQGGTFIGLTALGLSRARRLSVGDPCRTLAMMTAAFGLGQIVGLSLPVLSTMPLVRSWCLRSRPSVPSSLRHSWPRLAPQRHCELGLASPRRTFHPHGFYSNGYGRLIDVGTTLASGRAHDLAATHVVNQGRIRGVQFARSPLTTALYVAVTVLDYKMLSCKVLQPHTHPVALEADTRQC